MTQSQAVVLAAAIGAMAGILGAIVAGIISYFTQRSLLRRELHHARTRELFDRRLAALQNLAFAIDFIERMRDHDMRDDFATSTWHRLSGEVPCNLAFIPSELRQHFDLAIRSLYAGIALDARSKLDYAALSDAKAAVLRYIDTQFESPRT